MRDKSEIYVYAGSVVTIDGCKLLVSVMDNLGGDLYNVSLISLYNGNRWTSPMPLTNYSVGADGPFRFKLSDIQQVLGCVWGERYEGAEEALGLVEPVEYGSYVLHGGDIYLVCRVTTSGMGCDAVSFNDIGDGQPYDSLHPESVGLTKSGVRGKVFECEDISFHTTLNNAFACRNRQEQ